ncbi:MAG: aminotransferase class V-fold PLP-dependent enzyme [Clostridiales bacterium]|nr:aminotransferase class V-fold PLP-dependent enzyme [Clostridiales bacterium]
MSIYLDYSATTPLSAAALSAFTAAAGLVGNPHSSHPFGVAAAARLDGEKAGILARFSGAEGCELILTGSGSAANNLAVLGIADAYRGFGRHILTTPLEHPSVGGALARLAAAGYETEPLRILRDGKIDLDDLAARVRQDTVLVCVSAADAVLGALQPVARIAAVLKAAAPYGHLHVDGAQAVGKMSCDLTGADTFSFTAHKLYAPAGLGLLIRRPDTVLTPLVHGYGIHAGTPSVPLAAACRAALDALCLDLTAHTAVVRRHRARILEFAAKNPQIQINSPADGLPHIVNVGVEGYTGRQMQQRLAARGVMVSVQSACSNPAHPAPAVTALGYDRKRAAGAFRISLSHLTTDEEVRTLLNLLIEK